MTDATRRERWRAVLLLLGADWAVTSGRHFGALVPVVEGDGPVTAEAVAAVMYDEGADREYYAMRMLQMLGHVGLDADEAGTTPAGPGAV